MPYSKNIIIKYIITINECTNKLINLNYDSGGGGDGILMFNLAKDEIFKNLNLNLNGKSVKLLIIL
jgi:hypothetical protein